jgi:hypothetical protein
VQHDFVAATQTSPALQLHDSVPPHPSGALPQAKPMVAQVFGVQPQTPATPEPPHVSAPLHVQLTLPPQPSAKEPHSPLKSVVQVFGLQHVLPEHTDPVAQVQDREPPHPSAYEPHAPG